MLWLLNPTRQNQTTSVALGLGLAEASDTFWGAAESSFKNGETSIPARDALVIRLVD